MKLVISLTFFSTVVITLQYLYIEYTIFFGVSVRGAENKLQNSSSPHVPIQSEGTAFGREVVESTSGSFTHFETLPCLPAKKEVDVVLFSLDRHFKALK